MSKKTLLEKVKDIATEIMNFDITDAEAPKEEAVEAAPEVEAEVEEVVEAAVEVEVEVEIAPEVEMEVEATPNFATVEQLEEAVASLKSLFSSQVETLKAEKVELQKQIDEKPDAEIIKHTPKVELKQATASTKKGRITQFLNNK